MTNDPMKALKNLSLLSYIGLSMVLPILAGVWMGNRLDEKLQTGNIFLILFICISVLASFVSVYKIAMRDMKKK
ncbi:Putative F0F1-ATPase subunit Ca2+/Mg2+ transporter [Geosporobacter subterraneus DSM 17957]|uniref:Putative F0F1-ATPase subunit Ca2+/Mg2+ transporter n=1 Tax=Geosporobacter subterraneus DSM 17957 TaxID=1121919 RepID=A0A1M6CFR8_9FIRM|nr:AtpZ/AtpI family protein [Geosporobacter subterraneus]SHI59869.1 Putative F0F1-ATPase subunit Ca2+/Mg2+ transporter [Geosporobacter subterraneus DSM 17957]